MCGIFGVSGIEKAAQLTYLGLYALQHRGQESAGIVTVDDGIAYHHRGMGLVENVLDVESLERLPGNVSVGHTRYSTSGSSNIANAQPALVNYHSGALSLAHNGNLTNSRMLRRDLERGGSIFQSTSDSEVIVHLIARSDARSPDDQITDALQRIEGAYSLLLTVGDTLYAIVDPRGFRPLVVGTLGDGYVVASETCALDIVGAEPYRELQPGEWIKIENGQIIDMPPLETHAAQRCVFELVYFSRPDSVVFGRSVEGARRELGRQLAKEHPVEDADCVFSVPDSSNAMALGFAETSGIKPEHGLIRNHYVGRTFIDPGQASRINKVKIKFNPVKYVIENRKVVVIDDSLVRGTTSLALIKMIKHAGAKEIHLRIASPPITGPCYYGIDTPDKSQLIGAHKTVAEIAEHLGVDSLGYLSLDGMLKAVGNDPKNYCHACFSGKYSIPFEEELKSMGLEGPAPRTVAV